MKRLAALYDIHGNMPALEAVLRDVREAGADEIVVGGDVLPGPMPDETLDCLLGLDIPTRFVQGNCEIDILRLLGGIVPDTVAPRFQAGFRWVADQLSPEHRAAIASWPKTQAIHIGGFGEVMFCHATPRDASEIFTVRTEAERLLPIFTAVDVAAVVCGHTHMQFDRAMGKTRVINAGSVGMPFGRPGAYWLLFGPDPELRRSDYDFSAAADRVRSTSHPDAEDFAATSILNPPSEEEMLALYGRFELDAR